MRPENLSTSERRHFNRRAAIAPLCLCLVAAFHLSRVWTANQTPWKGGGFGMFSTVDDESARFLRCYLQTDTSELPLPLPPAADKTVAELRAAPTQAALDKLAAKLASQAWRWRDQRLQQQTSAIDSQRGVEITAATLRSQPSIAERGPSPPTGAGHVIEPIPRDESCTTAIPMTAVRVECRRYRFDAANQLLVSEALLTSTAKVNTAKVNTAKVSTAKVSTAKAAPQESPR